MERIYQRAAKAKSPETPTSEDKVNKKPKGVDSEKLAKNASAGIDNRAQLGLFDAFDLSTSNEYPTLFTRSPLFLAVPRSKQKALLDADNAYVFKCPWGEGRRAGPCLTVFDEEVLCALLKLRTKKLAGPPQNLPVPVEGKYSSQPRVEVHSTCCTVTQIINEMGLSDGGVNYENVLASVKRLGLVTVEIHTKSDHRYFGAVEVGGAFKIVDVEWAAFQEDGIVRAQFPPHVARWLEESYTYLDQNVRRKLRGDYVKLIHKFLSGQKSKRGFQWRIDEVATAIGYHGRKDRMKKTFEGAFKQLEKLEWLETWEISGTGRKSNPYIMAVTWPPSSFKR